MTVLSTLRAHCDDEEEEVEAFLDEAARVVRTLRESGRATDAFRPLFKKHKNGKNYAKRFAERLTPDGATLFSLGICILSSCSRC